MTTGDVYIQDTSDNAYLLSFRNGLFGPATAVMCGVREAVERGEARHERDLDSLVPGNVLRRILAEAELHGPAFSGSATPGQLRHFLGAVLSDETTYRVTFMGLPLDRLTPVCEAVASQGGLASPLCRLIVGAALTGARSCGADL